jgi:3-carboxy-cis,cis-muconate cycloisomerase
MTVSPFDSGLLGPLLGDAETARLFSDEAAIEAMIRVERALALAQASVGIVPAAAAQTIDRLLARAVVPPERLGEGTARAGVPVPALLAELRPLLPGEAARWLHWGATSQDVVDTALALRLATALDLLDARLGALLAALEAAAERWADLPMAGRTRSQAAAPIAFGARCRAWAAPFSDLRPDLAALRPRVARVQLGGSVGSNAVVAPHGPAIAAGLAAELGLADSAPWHTNRAGLAAFGNWCAAVAAATAKMAGDLVLMGRTESGEARAGAGGGSSTMPQKRNPVAAETVVALARYAAPLAAAMHLATIHGEERDGSAWTVEWLALPQLVLCAAGSLRHGIALATSLAPSPERMRAILELEGGGAMAEAATFLLAADMPRPDAEALVKRALAHARGQGTSLAASLQAVAPGKRVWAEELDPERLVRPRPRNPDDAAPAGMPGDGRSGA